MVLGGASEVPVDDEAIISGLRQYVAAGASRRDAIDAVCADLGVARNRVYGLAVAIDR